MNLQLPIWHLLLSCHTSFFLTSMPYLPRHFMRAVLFALGAFALIYYSSTFHCDAPTAYQAEEYDEDSAVIADEARMDRDARVKLAVKFQVLKELLKERFIPEQVVLPCIRAI